MVHRHSMGKEGMTLAVIAALAMTAVAFFVDTPAAPTSNTGICLPSPNDWGIAPVWEWIINTLVIFGVSSLFYGVNKTYSVIKGSDPVQPGMFLMMAMSNVWVSGMFTSGGILALVNLMCLWILFGCYRQRNATREIFVIGTLLSIGSMFEYAFIFMMPLYLIGAIMLKCFSFKALLAYGMGIVAPYWVTVGLGIIPLDAFHTLDLRPAFEVSDSKSELLIGLLNVGITAVVALLIGLSNAVKLYAGNTRRRLFNMVINLLGIFAAACMLFDFENLTAYLVTVYLVAAIQIGNLFELVTINRGGWWLAGIGAAYAASFVLMIAL